MIDSDPGDSATPATPATGAAWRVRAAVRAFLRSYPHVGAGPVCVGLSGGADSLALTAAAAAECGQVHAIVVDHDLQPGSAQVAARAAEQARALGATAEIVRAEVGTAGGPEAAARTARYAALARTRGERPVLLAHTRDDQAETVLLGLARGAGAHSLRAMAPWDPPFARPLLDVPAADTRAACTEQHLPWWDDPHNSEQRFRRVRVRREVLPLLEDVLGPGVAAALARTATQLRADDAVLADLAATALAGARIPDADSGREALLVEPLAPLPQAVLSRVVRSWLLAQGAAEVRFDQIGAVMALVQAWKGQGAVAVSAGHGGGRSGRHHEGGRVGAGPEEPRRERLMAWREGGTLRMGMRR